jgi:hypothetical protein
MSHNVNNKTAIKCKVSNKLHKILEPNPVRRSERWMSKNQKSYTDAEKVKLFDEIKKMHDETSEEYSNCLYKNRMRKKIKKLRDESGYTAKKKAKKASGRLFGHVE